MLSGYQVIRQATSSTTTLRMSSTPVYPPGVLQKITIPDPTSLDGFGDLEITLIPSRGVTDINHFSEKGIQDFKEMLYEIDEENRKTCALKMDAIQAHIDRFDRFANESWDFNSGPAQKFPWLWVNQEGGYDSSDCGWISYMDVPHFRDEYTAYVDYEIAEVLEKAEEDADYEEWINSKEYKESLKEYNLHKLLAWNKEEEGEHPKWSGEYKQLTQHGWSGRFSNLYNSFIKERYKVEVDVSYIVYPPCGNNYAKGITPYGDVYIPNKIVNYLKEGPGLYEMDIALQDVEGPPGKGPNSFRWTCVYLHNKGFSLE